MQNTELKEMQDYNTALTDVLNTTAIRIEPTNEYKVNSILNLVSLNTGISISDIKDKARNREYVLARQLCSWFIYKYTSLPLVLIGKSLGGRDHTTVIHSLRSMSNDIESRYQLIINTYDSLDAQIGEVLKVIRHYSDIRKDKSYSHKLPFDVRFNRWVNRNTRPKYEGDLMKWVFKGKVYTERELIEIFKKQ